MLTTPTMLIVPAVMVTPVLSTVIAADWDCSSTPLPFSGAMGVSDTATFALPVVSTTNPGIFGVNIFAVSGVSAALPQKNPVQIGWSGLPCSNSTQTPVPSGGTTYMPDWMPASGTHGIAQLDGSS